MRRSRLIPMPEPGFEPGRPEGPGSLSPPRLPVPPLRHGVLPPERRRARGAVHGADAPVLDLAGPGLGQDRPALEDLRVADVAVVLALGEDQPPLVLRALDVGDRVREPVDEEDRLLGVLPGLVQRLELGHCRRILERPAQPLADGRRRACASPGPRSSAIPSSRSRSLTRKSAAPAASLTPAAASPPP